MNVDGFIRLVSGNLGPVQTVTLRRSGSPDVSTPAAVLIGSSAATHGIVLVSDVQQTADKVMFASRELDAAGWTDEPHHGDQVVYANGRTTIVQGRAEIFKFDGGDRVFVLRTLGN